MDLKRGSLDRGSSRYYRKGQVTVFIIVGIIIVFAFAGILYLTKSTTTAQFDTEKGPILADVPQTFQPLQAYTENCLEQSAQKGLILVGQQGGYINPELLGDYSVRNPTDGVGLDLEPLLVPYWHYNAEANSANIIQYASWQPKLYAAEDPELSIEAQLSRYVNERLDDCLEGYAPFEQQGFVVTADLVGKKTTTLVGEEAVSFFLDMALHAAKGEAEVELEQFYVKIPLPLKHYYEVAERIAQAQQENFFLERQGMELVSIYSHKDPASLAPTSDVDYDLVSALSWQEANLQEKFEHLLASYVPMLRYLGSSNFYYKTFPEGGNLLAQRASDNMVLPLLLADDLEVQFDFFDWNTYFDTNSNSDGILKPDNIFINYGPLNFATQRFETHYDVSYPVLVTLKDEYGLDDQPYTFHIALEANIRNNAPASADEIVEPYPLGISSLACDEQQRNAGPIKSIVVDSFTNEPLELVKVGFTIPELDECEIGVTDSQGEVEEKYPSAYGGVINFVNPGYLSNYYPIDTQKYQDKNVLVGSAIIAGSTEKVIRMHKIVPLNLTVKKKNLGKCLRPLACSSIDVGVYKDISCEATSPQCFFNGGDSLFGNGEPLLQFEVNNSLSKYNEYYLLPRTTLLDENEEVSLTFERVRGLDGEILAEEFITPVIVRGNQNVEVRLVPGIYKVTGFSALKQKIVVPEDKRCFQYDILTREEQSCFPVEAREFEGAMTSTIQWDTESTYVEITAEDLYTSSQLTLYVVTQDLSSIPARVTVSGKEYTVSGLLLEDLQVAGQLAAVTKQPQIRRALEPTFN